MSILFRRIFLLLVPSLVLTACGGRTINKKNAQDIIAGQGLFKEKTLDIESVSETSPGQVIVQAKLPAAFRLQKVHGKWEIREVRVGNNQWEKLDDFVAALNRIKAEETQKMLGEVASAIERYRGKNGRLPDFRDYVSLSDALSPDYLSTLIRLDAWRNPLAATRTGPATVQLISAGPDGKIGTSDDVVLTRSYPTQPK
jgi:hypothetical protein